MYPATWPRCQACGQRALDGHITCGNARCDERSWRDRQRNVSTDLDIEEVCRHLEARRQDAREEEQNDA
jgi:hypothetical protein